MSWLKSRTKTQAVSLLTGLQVSAKVLAAGAMLVIATAAHAFESYPEYRWQSRSGTLRPFDPRPIDGEYTSDFITYQRPGEWHRRGPSAFDFSAGSLGSKDFLIESHLDLTARLTNGLQFRVIWFEDDDLEAPYANQILELSHSLGRQWRIAGYGHADANKAENDLGMALERTDDTSRLRWFVSAADFQRNIRNRDSDRWRKSQPGRAIGFVAEGEFAAGLGYSASLRWEPRSVWYFPNSSLTVTQERWAAQASLSRDGHKLSGAWDDHFKSMVANSSGDEVVRRQRLWLAVEGARHLGPQRLTGGLHHFYRRYRSPTRHVTQRDFLPYLNWYSAWRGTDIERQWQIGLDTNFRTNEFTGGWLDPDTDAIRIDSRLNFGHHWRFQRQAEIRLLLTLDLDSLGSGFWEGGAGQVRVPF